MKSHLAFFYHFDFLPATKVNDLNVKSHLKNTCQLAHSLHTDVISKGVIMGNSCEFANYLKHKLQKASNILYPQPLK